MLTGCGGNITDNGGIFLSPGYPGRYANGLSCIWHITVTPGLLVQLTFITFDVEFNPTCIWDYIQVFESGMEKYQR